MLKPSDFNNAVPQFQNGNYASNPINPQYVEEPSSTDYNRGAEPLQTLPAQWWNWFINKFTSRFNKVNIYVKNLFNELAQLLSLVNVTPDGTEGSVTDGQLKNAFKELYPTYVSDKLELGTTYVPQTREVNGHALTGNVTVSKSDVGLSEVVNTGDSAVPVSGGTTKFTTGGAYTELNKKVDKSSVTSTVASGNNNPVTSDGVYNAMYKNANYQVATSSVKYYRISSLGVSTSQGYNSKVFVLTEHRNAGISFIEIAGNGGDVTNFAVNVKVYGIYNNNARIYYENTFAQNGNWNGFNLYVRQITWSGFVLSQLSGSTSNFVITEVSETDLANATEITRTDVKQFLPNSPTTDGNYALQCKVASGVPAFSWDMDTTTAAPSDAVLHYSFDDVPDLPDGTADVRLIDNNTYDIQSTSYNFVSDNGGTLANSNGNILITGSGANSGAKIAGANLLNKLIKVRINITEVTGDIRIGTYTKTSYTLNKTGRYDIVLLYDYTGQYNNLYFHTNGTFTMIIEKIYIGDGSYSTPIIDNTSGQNNAVNNGSIAVQGVSGKGAYFLNGKYADIGNLTLAPNFAVSLWINPDNSDTELNGEVFYVPDQFLIRNGSASSSMRYLALLVHINGSWTSYNISNILPSKKWTHIVFVKNDSNIKAYIDGVLLNSITISSSTLDNSSGNALICKSWINNTRPQTVDDILIFNRALSDAEVQALYLNKANTQKFYDINNYNIDNATPVPAQNSNKLFSAGGAFDFFGQSTTSDSWLGKVFGRLLGRFWKHRTVKSGFSVNGVKYINGKYFAYGITGSTTSLGIFTSDDKVNWTQCSYSGSLTEKLNINDIQYNNNIYHALGFNNAVLLWSSNGIEWNDCTGIGSDDPLEIAYGNNIWVVACFGFSEENSIYWSANGKTFTRCTVNNMTILQMHSVTFANGMFVAGCVNKGIIWSEDGKIFTQGTGFPSTLSYFDKIIYNNGIWVAGSTNFRGDYKRGLWWSTDGKAWTQGTGPNVSSVSVRDMKFLNGKWIAIGINDDFIGFLSSVDGKAWVQITLQTTTLSNLDSVDYANYVWIVTAHDSGNYEAYAGESLESVKLVHTGAYSLDTEFKDIIFNQGSWFIGQGDGYAYSDFSTLDENELTD